MYTVASKTRKSLIIGLGTRKFKTYLHCLNRAELGHGPVQLMIFIATLAQHNEVTTMGENTAAITVPSSLLACDLVDAKDQS